MGEIGSPIVVGYVETPEGRAALDRAIAEAEQRGARLIVINSHRGGASLDRDTAVELDENLDEVHQLLHETSIDHEVRQLVRGVDPADDLVAVAEEVDADLIVIGLRKRSPVGKLILGSNAQQVLLEASCPVLAVKA
ncbi:MAG: universal stress protein [Frankiales bacterium]|nr:universal stress protein [Frankiales bacterium]